MPPAAGRMAEPGLGEGPSPRPQAPPSPTGRGAGAGVSAPSEGANEVLLVADEVKGTIRGQPPPRALPLGKSANYSWEERSAASLL